MLLYKDYNIEGLKIRIASRNADILFIGFPALSTKGMGLREWIEKRFKDVVGEGENTVMQKAFQQLGEYLRGERTRFTLPIHYDGSSFQKKVWNAVDNIPYGSTASYSEIASEIGCEKGMQAVGNAVGANPISIVTPCHRVVAKNSPGGYAWGLDLKMYLLSLENSVIY